MVSVKIDERSFCLPGRLEITLMTYLPKVFVDFLSQTKIHGKIKQASRGIHVARVRPLVPMASYITGFKQYLVDRSNHVISVCFNFDSIQY